MRVYWSLIGNGQINVGCTGQTVYLLDQQGGLIASFRDLKYAYMAAISPRGDTFVVKTTDGRMAVYSVSPPALIKKFRYSKVDAAQDDNFCFSPDGKLLYNIERHVDELKTALSIYDTADFSLRKRILADDESLCLSEIEYDPQTEKYYLLGFWRDADGAAMEFFVGTLTGDALTDLVPVPEQEWRFTQDYIELRMMGFTKKAYEWSDLFWHNHPELWTQRFEKVWAASDPEAELEAFRQADVSLARLWRKYRR